MKSAKEQNIRDFKIEAMELKKRYIIVAMELKKKTLEEKEKIRKLRVKYAH